MSHDYFAVHISLLYSQVDRNIEEMLQPKHIYLQMFENLFEKHRFCQATNVLSTI